MKQRQITLAKILTYNGTLPIIASVCIHYFSLAGLESNLITKTYSAIIIGFICGIHWGSYVFFADKCPRNLLITSNAVALLAWTSLLITQQPITLFLQSLCFLYLLTLDLRLRDAEILPQWFYVLRRNATIIVVLCLAMLAVLS